VSSIRLLVVDDHPTFLRAISVMLEADADIDVVGTAADGAEAVDAVIAHQPDVVLMDIGMPDTNGIAATSAILDIAPHVAVVMLTMFEDDENVGAAMRAGARGYLLKGATREEIRGAIAAVAAGQAIFGTAVARRLRTFFAVDTDQAEQRPFAQLTDRELDVLDCVAAGLDNSTTAGALFLSEKTVRNYVSLILSKLAVSTRSEAIVAGRDAGLGRR
jgi:DNA-binding NarL/FixJ family response regulator